MLRIAKILLVFAVGIWGLIGTIGNLTGIDFVYQMVSEVTWMRNVPEDTGPPWRTTNPVIVWTGVLLIVLGKIAALAGGLYGGYVLARHYPSEPAVFHAAKKWAVAGCGFAFALTFLGFTVFGETAFFMFYYPQHVAAAEGAFRFSASFALAALFIAQREPG